MFETQEQFSDYLKATITFWREHRVQNLHQRKLPGLVKDWHQSRLLTFQAAYMLLTRAIINLSAKKDEGIAISYDAAFLEVVMQWVNSATDRTLFEVHQASDDHRLFLCFFALYLEQNDMGEELVRRQEHKRFTVEFIRTQWGGEDRTDEVEKSFQVGTKQFAPDLMGRFQKDSANEKDDFTQLAWLKLLEWWEEERDKLMRRNSSSTSEIIEWFDYIPLLPHEQAFFDGPIKTAWVGSLPQVRADYDVLLKTEAFPRTLRMKREAAVETIERRQDADKQHWRENTYPNGKQRPKYQPLE